MGVVTILDMWPGPFEQTFIPRPNEPPYDILIDPVVSEEMFGNVDGRTSERRCDWYTISSPMSLRLRWANNHRHVKCIFIHP